MAHDHDHGGAGHDHAHAHGASERSIAIAAVLTGVFMLAEFAGGLFSGSLALIADAGHMLIDCASLGLAWAAFRVARRPADLTRTYGFDRLQVMVAFANGLVLFPVGGWIIYEAIERLQQPAQILGGTMLWIAVGGLVVNIAAFLVLHGGEKDNVNVRGALLHVMGDLLGSVGAIVAALVILLTGWTPIDPILSVFVSIIVLGGAYRLVRDAGHILLEGAPQHLDTNEIARVLVAHIHAVRDVHHVHLWSITEKRVMATLHASLIPYADGPKAVREIKALLEAHFKIDHATVEVEYGTCSEAGKNCSLPGDGHAAAPARRPAPSPHHHGHDHGHDHGHSHRRPYGLKDA
jgi:cobalt-zinc-cadmium efflux system protein